MTNASADPPVPQDAQDAEAEDAPPAHGTTQYSANAPQGGTAIGHACKVFINKVRKNRSRILVVVTPVFVTGGAFLAGTLVPHQSAPEHRAQGRGPAPSVLFSPRSPSPAMSSSAPPSVSAAAPLPEAPLTTRTPSGPGPRDRAGEAAPPPGRAPGSTIQGSAPPAPSPEAGTLSPGSRSHLENVGRGQCVSGDASFPSFDTCSASYSYSWTLRSNGDSTFALVNRASGNCLTAPVNDVYRPGLSACGSGNDHWRIGTTTSAGQTLQNTETSHCLVIAPPAFGGGDQVLVTTCNPDDPRQLWKGSGPA